MADNKIQFSIGSIFSDEGFTKLNNAVKTAGRETKNAQGIFREMLGEASQMDNAFGQMAGQIGGVVQAFASMGVVGGVLAVVREGVDLLVGKLNELEQEYDSVWQKLNEEIEGKNIQTFKTKMDDLKNTMSQVKDVTLQNISTFDQMANSIAAMSTAIAKVEGASGNLTISQMMVDKFNEIMQQETEAGKKVVEAKWNLALAEEKALQDQEALEAQRTEANRRLLFAQDKVTQIEDALALARENLSKATDTATFAEQKWGETSDKYTNAVARRTEAQNTVNELEKKLADSKLQSQVAEQQLKETTIKLTDSQVAGELKIQEASAAFEAASEAITKVTQQMVEASWEEAAIEQKNILLENLEAQSSFGLTQQEVNQALDLYRQQLDMGRDADFARVEVERQLTEEKRQREEENKEIELLAKNSNTNLTAAREAYKEALDQGYADQEAYNVALQSLKESAEGLGSQMDTSTNELKDQKKDGNDAHASVSVTINPEDVANGTQGTVDSISTMNTEVQNGLNEQSTSIKNQEQAINNLATLLGKASVLGDNASSDWAKQYSQEVDKVFAQQLQKAGLDDKGRTALLNKYAEKHSLSKKEQEKIRDYIQKASEGIQIASGQKKK